MVYELFELRRVVRFSGPVAGSLSTPGSASSVDADSGGGGGGVTACVTASRRIAHHTLLACCLSNNTVVLRYTSQDGSAVVRTLPCGAALGQRVEAIAIDASAEWALALTHDGSCMLIPALAFLAPDASPNLQPPPGPADKVTTTPPIRALSSRVTCCAWWRTFAGGHIAVVGSRASSIVFVELSTGTVKLSLKTRGVVHSLDIVTDRAQGCQYLLCRAGEQTLFLLLEQEVQLEGGLGFETVLDSSKRQPFLPVPVHRFKSGTTRLQDRRASTVVGVSPSDGHMIEVYNHALDRMPVFVFEVGQHVHDALLSENLLYIIDKPQLGSEGGRDADPTALQPTLRITSRLLSCTVPDADAVRSEFLRQRSLMQRFALPSEDEPLHVCARPPRADSPTAENGCIVVTTQGIYECRPVSSPEAVFQSILRGGQDADHFGAAMGLDLSEMYTQAAEDLLADGDYTRALGLFQLARLPHSDIVCKFANAGQTALLVPYLRQVLANSASLTAAERTKLSDVLFLCYLEQICRSDAFRASAVDSHTDELDQDESDDVFEMAGSDSTATLGTDEDLAASFSRFLVDNLVYDIGTSTVSLLNHGLLDVFLEVVEARSIVTKALSMPVNHGSPGLNAMCRKLLLERGYVDAVCDCYGGVMLRCMPPEEAVGFLVERPNNMLRCMQYVAPRLLSLSESCLLRLARYFDPSQKATRALMTSLPKSRRPMLERLDAPSDGPELCVQDVVEWFVRVLLALARLRRSQGASPSSLARVAPWLSRPKKALQAALEVVAPDAEDHADLDASRAEERAPVAELQQKQPSDLGVACGAHHGVVIRGTEVFTWGKAKSGRLGHGDIIAEAQRSGPQRVETLHMLGVKVLGVACGAEHVIARCSTGLFAWGANSRSQLGTGNTLERTRPTLVADMEDDVAVVACGRWHSMALGTDGSAWTWGWGEHGQLGTGRTKDVCVPTKLNLPDGMRVVDLDGGAAHSVFLTEQGYVLSCGSGKYGQLGHGLSTKQLEPKIIEALRDEPCRLIACGPHQTYFVTFKDRFLQCGRSFFEKRTSVAERGSRPRSLSSSSSASTNTMLPKVSEISIPPRKIANLCCGAHHGLLITDDGLVASWGVGDSGQLGHENKLDCTAPKVVQSLREYRVARISVGESFSVVVDDEEQVWVWGSGRAGELGMDCALCTPMLLPDLPPLRLETLLPSDGQDFAASSLWTMGRTPPHGSSSSKFQSRLQPVLDEEEDLPTLSAKLHRLSVPYGGWSLPIALTALQGQFGLMTVMRACDDLDDVDTKAHLHVMCGDLAVAFGLRVKSLLRWTSLTWPDDPEERKQQLQHHVALLCSAFFEFVLVARTLSDGGDVDLEQQQFFSNVPAMTAEETAPHLSAIITRISELWAEQEFEVSEFENVLLHNASVTVRTALDLLEGGSPKGVLDSLSGSFYLQLGRLRFTQGAALLKMPSSARLSGQQLWSSIVRNIAKDIQARTSATILCVQDESASSASAASSRQQADGAMGDTVVFTCGHDFTRRAFTNEAIPELRRRLQGLPFDVQASSQLLVQEYLKQRPCVACPHCVFAALRRRFINEMPTANIPAWVN
eukprot:m.46672 g.46672  ORF g.46672 m.46672 type:complete len:1586 (-) comp11874_c0_seq2:28-4785(-)